MNLFELLRPRWRHNDPDVDAVAIGSVSDVGALKEAYDGGLVPVRLAAIARLKVLAARSSTNGDQAFAARIVLSDPSPQVREAAVDLIEEPDTLAKVFLLDDERVVRIAASVRLA